MTPLTETAARSVQLLARAFDVGADDEGVLRALDAVTPRAVQRYPVRGRHRLEIVAEGGGHRLVEDGVPGALAAGPAAAAELALARMHAIAFAALAHRTKGHAGSASLDGRRLLAVARGRSGKSTLMIRLLYEGFAVHGDEMVVLEDGLAVAYPRRLGIRQRTLTLVPPLAALAPELAGRPDTHGFQVLALDPVELGFAWEIEPSPVDVVLYLRPNHGGPSRLAPCPHHVMARYVMTQSTAPTGGGGQWIRDVSAIIRPARCFTLDLGDLEAAVAAVREALGASVGRPVRL